MLPEYAYCSAPISFNSFPRSFSLRTTVVYRRQGKESYAFGNGSEEHEIDVFGRHWDQCSRCSTPIWQHCPATRTRVSRVALHVGE